MGCEVDYHAMLGDPKVIHKLGMVSKSKGYHRQPSLDELDKLIRRVTDVPKCRLQVQVCTLELIVEILGEASTCHHRSYGC